MIAELEYAYASMKADKTITVLRISSKAELERTHRSLTTDDSHVV